MPYFHFLQSPLWRTNNLCSLFKSLPFWPQKITTTDDDDDDGGAVKICVSTCAKPRITPLTKRRKLEQQQQQQQQRIKSNSVAAAAAAFPSPRYLTQSPPTSLQELPTQQQWIQATLSIAIAPLTSTSKLRWKDWNRCHLIRRPWRDIIIICMKRTQRENWRGELLQQQQQRSII